MTRWVLGLGLTAALVVGLVWALPLRRASLPMRVTLAPAQLVADGYDTATLTIAGAGETAPRVNIEPAHTATVEDIIAGDNGWQARIRAGVIPVAITVRVAALGLPPATVVLNASTDLADSAADGTPDFLRFEDADDQRAFRRWFTFLAETQYFQPAALRPVEIVDCAALIRYAYREALRAHDGAWATEARLPVVPGIPAVAKYQYPYTPLGANLFRVKSGSFLGSDIPGGGFAQFADAKTLQLRNTHFVTRDLERAEPGDLLFYRQDSGHMPFHSMIYLGASQIENDRRRYLVYHTGPDGENPGELRRPTVEELRRFPDADWRPLPGNARFLGVYRWNILRKSS